MQADTPWDTRITKLVYRRSPAGERKSGSTTEKMEKVKSMKTEEKRNWLWLVADDGNEQFLS